MKSRDSQDSGLQDIKVMQNGIKVRGNPRAKRLNTIRAVDSGTGTQVNMDTASESNTLMADFEMK